jgi:hypothetical protein
MDNLELKIKQLREEIQNDLPPDGHFERFDLKLARNDRKHSNYWIGFISGMVAVAVIGIILFFHPGKEETKPMTLSSVSQQYAEVEFYYTRSISEQTHKLIECSEKYGSKDPSLKMMVAELEEYDQTYAQICKELRATPNDERVINAMITYYQTKLEIINKILKEIESKQKSNKGHENVKI